MRNGSRWLSGAGAQTLVAAIPSPYLADRMNQRQLHASNSRALTWLSAGPSWQFRVLGFGLVEDGDVRVGVFP